MERLILICTILACCLACTAENETDYQDNNGNEITQSAEIILSVEKDEVIANPTRITASNNGFILYDDALNQIAVFTNDGDHVSTFGRQGRGPGEFQSVSTLRYDSGTIIVSDSELLRLTGFGSDGKIVSNHDLTASLFAMDNAILSSSRYITPTNGQEGGLAKFVDSEAGNEFVFGEPVTKTPEAADFNQWHQDLSAGKVPDFFRNRIAVSGNESLFYLFLQTEGVLRQYSSDGDLIWEKQIEIPEFEKEFERFVERNKDNPPGRMYMLQYVHKMEQTEDGVYMLLRIPGEFSTTLLFVDSSGENHRYYRFKEMEYRPSHFSISPDRQWVYFLNTSQGIIYRSSFPG
jgi:hypothetical protein